MFGWWTNQVIDLYCSFNTKKNTYCVSVCCSALSMVGLILIAFGTGGIKPCVAAFGGDQFDEEHVRHHTSSLGLKIWKHRKTMCVSWVHKRQSAQYKSVQSCFDVFDLFQKSFSSFFVWSPPDQREAEILLHFLHVDQCRQPAVHCHHTHPEKWALNTCDLPTEVHCVTTISVFQCCFAPAGDVQCFGGDCYALAFGVPAALMIVALGECPSTCNTLRSHGLPIAVKVWTLTTVLL